MISCRAVMLAVLTLIMLLYQVATFTDFGFPTFGSSGFDDFYGHGYGYRNNGWGSPSLRDSKYYGLNDLHDDDAFGYWRPHPCPRYQPLSVSEWQHGPGKQFVLRVALPGVREDHADLWLSKDSTAVHVEAMRTLPMGRRECLPEGARVSADGRHEILESVIRVPSAGDANRASVRHVRGGLQLVMPQRPQSAGADSEQGETGPSARSEDRIDSGRGTGFPSYPSTRQSDSSRRRAQYHPTPVESKRPQVQLPSSAGIVVEDTEYPWPEKHQDASAGWFDNRGDFQTY